MSERVLELENLSKTYGGKIQAVRGVTLSVGAGEVYGFLGPNGAGKSTTIRMLLTLIRPTGGTARVFGHDVRSSRQGLNRVGSLVDGGTFYPFLSGRENLRVLARTAGLKSEARIDPLLRQVGLGDDGHRKVKAYSTGMKQRLGVAAALLNDPQLVILDEPVNGLDAAGVAEMRTLIRTLSAKEGRTVFLSSHLLNEVQQVCDRVSIIDHGTVIHEGSVADLLTTGDVVRIEAQPIARVVEALGGLRHDVLDDGAVRVHATRAEAPDLVRRLTAAGVDVFAITPERRSLEEAFLAITGEAGHA